MKNQRTSGPDVNAIKGSLVTTRALTSLRVGRKLGLTVAVLTAWSLLAWGAAEALITGPEGSHAQVMVVLSNVGAYIERTHHAAELWRAGSAPKVILTNDGLQGSWSQAKQRNLFSYEWATEELERSGVPAEVIEILPNRVNSTFDEALLVRDYAVRHDLNSVLIVTSAYHSRRALSIFRRVFKDTGVDIEINPAAGEQTPHAATWWLSRLGWQTVGPEYPKIAYFWLRQLFSGTPQIENFVPEVRKGAADPEVNGPLIAPAKAFVDEVVLIDARQSTGVSRMPQRDGSASEVLGFGDGFTANLLASGHAYRTPGTYTIKLEGRNDTGQVVVREERTIVVSDIPTVSPINTRRLSDTGNAVTNGANLQRAIDQASRSNVTEQEILLPAGAIFAGPIVLTVPNGPNSGNKYITVRSANLGSLPVSGNRVGPNDSANMATITAPSSSSAGTPALSTPLPAPLVPSHHYRLIGLHFKKDSGNQSQVLVSLGDHNLGQNSYSMQPTEFIVDRCYFEGGAGTSNLGLRIAADFVTVKDSYFDNFKVATGVDAVAVAISKGKGPFAIWNNYLEASSENFYVGSGPIESWTATVSSPTTSSCTLSSVAGLEVDMNIVLPVGGATTYNVQYSTIVRSISGNNITFDSIPSAPFNTGTAKWAITPSFVEFRHNYCFKPLTWRASDPSYAGTQWQIKNLWETKAMRYGVIDGNVLQNSWVESQAYGIALTPRKTNGFEHEAAVIRQLQFSNNIFWNMGNGVAIAAYDDQAGLNPVQLTRDITFRNNLWRNIGENWDPTSGPYRQFFSFTSTGSPVRVKNVHFIHNTFDPGTYSGTGMVITAFGTNGDGSGVTSGTFLNNLLAGIGGFFSSSASGAPATNITEFMAPGTTANWNKNLIVNPNGLSYPAGAITQTSIWSTAVFHSYGTGDFSLKVGGRGKSAALDNTDVGVNMVSLKALTFGALSGIWNAEPSRNQGTRPRIVGIR